MTTLKQKLIVSLEKRIYNVEEFADEIVNFQKEILLNKLREQYKDFYSTKYSREKESMYFYHDTKHIVIGAQEK